MCKIGDIVIILPHRTYTRRHDNFFRVVDIIVHPNPDYTRILRLQTTTGYLTTVHETYAKLYEP
jgi:hypothetical protein